MAQRRFHYEQAFERYLRQHAIPYVAVDEAKRAPGHRSNPPAHHVARTRGPMSHSRASISSSTAPWGPTSSLT